MKRFLSLGAVLLLVTACGGKPDSETVKEGVDFSKNPLEALNEVNKLQKDLEKVTQDLQNLEPVDPVPFADLIESLPDQPSAWEAEEAEGETNSVGEFKISQAERTYRQGEKQIEVKIIDWAHNQALSAPFVLSSRFSQESTKGYNKGIQIGESVGREEYKNDSKRGSLNLLVGKRFLVEISGRQIEPAELRQWWEQVKTEELLAKAQ